MSRRDLTQLGHRAYRALPLGVRERLRSSAPERVVRAVVVATGRGDALPPAAPAEPAATSTTAAVTGATAPTAAPAAAGAPVGAQYDSNTDYWTDFNVTAHHRFRHAADSLDYLAWRNDQYLGYEELFLRSLGTLGGKRVLDFGCGPAHDVLWLAEYTQGEVVGADVSRSSTEEARARLALHPRAAQRASIVTLDHDDATFPFEDESFDVIVTSGVLHHIPAIEDRMRELCRVLRPGGVMHVMVYNYHSVFVHLYVAWSKQIVNGINSDLDLAGAFQRSTDGPDCPHSITYTPEQMAALASRTGFTSAHLGNAISAFEMQLLPSRFDAILDRRLALAHRRFLADLTFDDRGRPLHEGQVAGVDAVFRLTKN